jgi:4'-phosphopantetheinyl transferase
MEPLWSAPNKQTQINKGAVHIWRATLDLSSRDIRFFDENLSIDERIKAGHFRFDRDRNRYIVSFGILKSILGLYIGVEPGSVRISYGNHGKPRLSDADGKRNIHFNLSHSEELAIYVFARDYEVGVDIERIRELPEMNQIVDHYFSASERKVFLEMPSDKRRKAFFYCWTRKEALIKAVGYGLYQPLDKFTVPMAAGESASVPFFKGDSKQASSYVIEDFSPAPGYAGAIALEEKASQFQFCQWAT